MQFTNLLEVKTCKVLKSNMFVPKQVLHKLVTRSKMTKQWRWNFSEKGSTLCEKGKLLQPSEKKAEIEYTRNERETAFFVVPRRDAKGPSSVFASQLFRFPGGKASSLSIWYGAERRERAESAGAENCFR